jgi:hypothetical protein
MVGMEVVLSLNPSRLMAGIGTRALTAPRQYFGGWMYDGGFVEDASGHSIHRTKLVIYEHEVFICEEKCI